MAKDIWRTPYAKRHLRVLNVLARLFGLVAIIGGAAAVTWGVYFLRTSPGVIVSGSAALDYLGAGVFCLVVGVAFVAVRPYRPDLILDARASERSSWWTGESR